MHEEEKALCQDAPGEGVALCALETHQPFSHFIGRATHDPNHCCYSGLMPIQATHYLDGRGHMAPRSLPKYHVTPTRYAPLLHGTMRLCAPSLTSQGPSFADFTPPGACYDIPHSNIDSLFPNLLVLAMKHELFGSRICHSHDHRVLTNHTYP